MICINHKLPFGSQNSAVKTYEAASNPEQQKYIDEIVMVISCSRRQSKTQWKEYADY